MPDKNSQLLQAAAEKVPERPRSLHPSLSTGERGSDTEKDHMDEGHADALLQAQHNPTRRDTLEKIKILRIKQEETGNKSIRETGN